MGAMSGASGMTLHEEAPVPVRAVVDAADRGEAAAFAAAFTPDALLVVAGRQARGRDAIAQLARSGPSSARFELQSVTAGATEQDVVAMILMTGDGAVRTVTGRFTLRGDEVARLEITT